MSNPDYYRERLGTTWRDPAVVVLQAVFTSGVAVKIASASDPDVTITRDAVGDYDVAGLPRGRRIQCLGATVDLASDTPAATATAEVQPRSLSASAGTGKLLFFDRDDGVQTDPPDGARVFATFFVEAP